MGEGVQMAYFDVITAGYSVILHIVCSNISCCSMRVQSSVLVLLPAKLFCQWV